MENGRWKMVRGELKLLIGWTVENP